MSDSKLLKARAEIEAIIDRHDIAAHVVLHNAPGSLEIFYRLQPSYSRLIGLPPMVRLRSKLAEYKGDADAQRRDLEATANMVSGIATALGGNAMMMLELASLIDGWTGAKHTEMRRDDGSSDA